LRIETEERAERASDLLESVIIFLQTADGGVD